MKKQGAPSVLPVVIESSLLYDWAPCVLFPVVLDPLLDDVCKQRVSEHEFNSKVLVLP